MQLPPSHPVGTTVALRRRLRSVYWIGGGSGAGKSTVARQIADAHGLHLYSTDDLIVEDLLDLPEGEAVVVEGFRLLPSAVNLLLDDVRRALWLLPTPGFRRLAFESRGTLWDIAGRTARPHVALANLLERDRLFTERLRDRTDALGLPALDVDGTVDEASLVDAVAGRLGFGSGPSRGDRE